VRRTLALTLLAAVALVALAGTALGDTAPIPTSPDLPWTDPAHQSPLELLAGRIASHIAGRPVTVRCEGDTDWAMLVSQAGGDPSAELGYVATSWNSVTGQLVSASSVAELAAGVCLPLQTFAAATAKPTKCAPAALVPPSSAITHAGARGRTHSRPFVQRPGPCYLGRGRTAGAMPASYWANYAGYAVAILTLAHESIHLSGVVGGQLANGLQVGDPQAEAKADCYGIQSMPYVAEQLGDTPDDARAIAMYFWDKVYPRARLSSYAAYWSADCRPGGPLDVRPPGSTAWP
jgi:hypothetical protein